MAAKPGDKRLRAVWEERRYALGRLLLMARRDYIAHLTEAIRAEGETILPEACIILMPYLEIEGTRATTLAERSGLTKQRIGKITDDMQRLGLVERRPDSADGRAWTIVFTSKGLERLYVVHKAIRAVEKQYMKRIGMDRLEQMRGLLSCLVYGAEKKPGG